MKGNLISVEKDDLEFLVEQIYDLSYLLIEQLDNDDPMRDATYEMLSDTLDPIAEKYLPTMFIDEAA